MKRISPKTRWLLLAGVAAAGLVACGAVWWGLHRLGYGMRESVDWVLAQVRSLGPAAFFGLMALLPALGAPLSLFTLTAGPVFTPVLGLPVVILLSLLSLGINLSLTYALARWFLRPWVERLCVWLGFTIPEVADVDQRSLVILVRVTPGPPYALQNYLLGMAKIPFATYFAISWVVVSAYGCAFIVFGDAIAQGKGRGAVLGASLLIALTVGIRFLRRWMQRKNAPVPVP